MATKPVPVRFDPEILSLLREGSRRTPHKKQELIRITLRRHLAAVIEAEASRELTRLTNITPWPEDALREAYKRVGREWDHLEAAALVAQGKPSFED